jgi:uncharacterized membrane protein YphA (DoxX/SURF4 family)
MLNIFPDLLSFSILVPVILRITVGLVFIYISYFVVYKSRQNFFDYYKNHNYPLPAVLTTFFGVLSSLTGLFFLIGFFTQVVALIAIYLLVTLYLSDKEIKTFEFGKSFYLLVGIICFCLVISGAGIFAVDMPL